jgi:hypothetical protein
MIVKKEIYSKGKIIEPIALAYIIFMDILSENISMKRRAI